MATRTRQRRSTLLSVGLLCQRRGPLTLGDRVPCTVRLNRRIDTGGFMGRILSSAKIFEGLINMVGYPSDKGTGLDQYLSICTSKIERNAATFLTTCDGSFGQSGGPIFSFKDSAGSLKASS